MAVNLLLSKQGTHDEAFTLSTVSGLTNEQTGAWGRKGKKQMETHREERNSNYLILIFKLLNIQRLLFLSILLGSLATWTLVLLLLWQEYHTWCCAAPQGQVWGQKTTICSGQQVLFSIHISDMSNSPKSDLTTCLVPLPLKSVV